MDYNIGDTVKIYNAELGEVTVIIEDINKDNNTFSYTYKDSHKWGYLDEAEKV